MFPPAATVDCSSTCRDDAPRVSTSPGGSIPSSLDYASRPTPDPALVDRATAKAFVRLLPLLFLCYVIAYIDRSNVGYAKLTMKQDLPAFDNRVIGFGAGMWIARIMVTWGIVAAATAFVKTPMQFYTARFMLGLAEAGFYPGVIVYLTHWFPNK